MGQNNDPKEYGDPQGQQGGGAKISKEERKRQSGYPTPEHSEQDSSPDVRDEQSSGG